MASSNSLFNYRIELTNDLVLVHACLILTSTVNALIYNVFPKVQLSFLGQCACRHVLLVCVFTCVIRCYVCDNNVSFPFYLSPTVYHKPFLLRSRRVTHPSTANATTITHNSPEGRYDTIARLSLPHNSFKQQVMSLVSLANHISVPGINEERAEAHRRRR